MCKYASIMLEILTAQKFSAYKRKGQTYVIEKERKGEWEESVTMTTTTPETFRNKIFTLGLCIVLSPFIGHVKQK